MVVQIGHDKSHPKATPKKESGKWDTYDAPIDVFRVDCADEPPLVEFPRHLEYVDVELV